MKIAIFEIGDHYEIANITRVFSSVEKAKENIPTGFIREGGFPFKHYYENESDEKWLTIKEYRVEE